MDQAKLFQNPLWEIGRDVIQPGPYLDVWSVLSKACAAGVPSLRVAKCPWKSHLKCRTRGILPIGDKLRISNRAACMRNNRAVLLARFHQPASRLTLSLWARDLHTRWPIIRNSVGVSVSYLGAHIGLSPLAGEKIPDISRKPHAGCCAQCPLRRGRPSPSRDRVAAIPSTPGRVTDLP